MPRRPAAVRASVTTDFAARLFRCSFGGHQPRNRRSRGQVTLTGVMSLLARGAVRQAHRVGAALTEMDDAQRRVTYRMLSYDGYLADPDTPPGDYREFLLRTSGPLAHEPSARKRLAGRRVH